MTTWNGRVAASSDDASENSGVLGLRATTPALGGGTINLGFRFLNVTIPQGSTINSAALAVYVTDAAADDPNCGVLLENADNAGTFTTGTNDITNRTKTGSVTWNATSIGTGFKSSPDIASIVQTVINRVGWASGNALAVILDGVAGTNMTVQSYDGSAANAATLSIDYTPPAQGAAVKAIYYGMMR